MQFKDYEKTKNLLPNNILLLDGDAGTKTITAEDLAKEILKLTTQDMYFDFLDEVLTLPQRRMTFRGKNLGDHVTDEQYAAIGDGSFKGLFTGDYWAINGVNYRIADFDYWMGTGASSTSSPGFEYPVYSHHAVIFPDGSISSSVMYESGKENQGYANSKVRYSFVENGTNTLIYDAFGSRDHILGKFELLTSSALTGTWASSLLELPSQEMLTGSSSVYLNGMPYPEKPVRYVQNLATKQFALCCIAPQFIPSFDKQSYWLRDYSDYNSFAIFESPTGIVTGRNQTTNMPIRPVFGIKAA